MTQKSTKPPKKPPQKVDERFQFLLTLITLLRDARHKTSKPELEFLLVNQTYNLVPYRHCVYWEKDGLKITVRTSSGLVHVDPDAPYVQWLRRALLSVLEKHDGADRDEKKKTFASVYPVNPEDLPEGDAQEWGSWVSAHALIVIMKNRDGAIRGGLWIDRDAPFAEIDAALLEDLGDGYADSLSRFERDARTRGADGIKSFFSLRGNRLKILTLVCAAAMFLPVRLSVTAPAEVVATNPVVVSVPFDGTIDDVEVLPGQQVEQGDVLMRMESTVLRNRAQVAESEMLAAEVALRKTEREALTERSKLAEIALLKAQLEQKIAEREYAEELLGRAEIKADRDGIVIFADPNALRGKPAHTGEQAMLLADPEESELLIRVPVNSMIRIDMDYPAKFFLTVNPLISHRAIYKSVGYQATVDPDGLMTYKIRADFAGEKQAPRIGWTGTGKVYGAHTILGYNIFRRPLVTLRRKLGV